MGAALLLPFTLPPSPVGRIWLALSFLTAGIVAYAAIQLHQLLATTTLTQAIPPACAAIALGGALLWFVTRTTLPDLSLPQTLLGLTTHIALQTTLIFLTLYLLRQLNPLLYSTRFLLAPLLTVLEGYLFFRPKLTWTFAAGVLLLAASTFALTREEHQT